MCDIIRHIMGHIYVYCCGILLHMTSWSCACSIVYRITRQVMAIYACHYGILDFLVHVRYIHINFRDVSFYLSWTRICIRVTLWTCKYVSMISCYTLLTSTCVSVISCYTLWTYTCDSVIITIRYGHVHAVV